MTDRDRHIDRRSFLTRAAVAGAGVGYFGLGLPASLGGLPTARAATRNPPFRAFNMLVLGDSYISQPGLLKEQRSWSLVASSIAAHLEGFRTVNPPRVFARSGAEIRPEHDTPDRLQKDLAAPWPGDKPDAFWEDPHPNGDKDYAAPSLWRQLLRSLDPQHAGFVPPNEVDLVFLGGGGNDVGVTNIVTPAHGDNNHGYIRMLANNGVGRMLPLLDRVAHEFPMARIVVVGYPQLVSARSAALEVTKYLAVLGVAGGSLIGGSTGAEVLGVAAIAASPALKEGARSESQVFAEVSSAVLQDAVRVVNVGHGNRAVFADIRPHWDDNFAYGAPQSHFWHFTAPLNPPDNTHDARWQVCKTHDFLGNGTSDIKCAHGAMGHYNVAGARVHADAAIAALDTFGLGWMGLKGMTVCADVVVTAAPTVAAHGSGGVEPNPNISDETFSVILHARDAGTNAAIAATADVAGKSTPLDTAFPLKLCTTAEMARGRGALATFVTVCKPTAVTVRLSGYAPVVFQASDMFAGKIPGSPSAAAAVVGKAFHYCAPPARIGTPFGG